MGEGINRTWATRVAVAALGVILLFLIVLPVAGVALASLTRHIPRIGRPLEVGLTNYAALWNRDSVTALQHSLLTSLGGTILASIIGSGLAILQSRTDVFWKPLVAMAGIVPLFVTALIGALAWGILASPNAGLINVALRQLNIDFQVDIYTTFGIMFVFGIYYAPYSYLFVSSALNLMDPQLEEAGHVHGATTWEVLTRITLPAATPAILGGGIVSFVLMMENFSVPALLGARSNINTISTRIYYLVTRADRPTQGAAIGIVLVAMMASLLLIQRKIQARRSYATVTGKGFRPRMIRLGRWRPVAVVAALLYLVSAVFAPLVALLNLSLRPFAFIDSLGSLFDPSTVSFTTMSSVATSDEFHTALVNSLTVGAQVAVVGGALAFFLSYVVTRTKLRGKRFLGFVATMPLAVPGLLMGMGFLWVWLPLPIPLYGTVFILTLAFVARYLPQAFTSASSVIGSVHPDLEDSGVVCGSSRVGAFTRFTLPLIKTGVASTALLLVLLSMRELAASLFLFTSDTVVLSILIFSEWQNGNLHIAATMSLLYSAVLLTITLLGRRWLVQREVNTGSIEV